MRVMSVIASVILILVPTISLIQSLREFKKRTKGELVGRKACMTFVATSLGIWSLFMALLWLAGVFKNF